MAYGRFTTSGVTSPNTFDQGKAAFYRQQEESRREQEHAERSARWIAGKLAGHQYDTLAGMEAAVVEYVTEWQGDAPDDEMMGTIHRACVLLWMGEVDRDSYFRKAVERNANGVTFLRMA
jgi:hypothetical protein